MDKKEEYTINDLCKMFDVTMVTIGRWKKRGLPFYKRGRNVFFKIEEVQEWIEEQNKVKRYNTIDKQKPVN